MSSVAFQELLHQPLLTAECHCVSGPILSVTSLVFHSPFLYFPLTTLRRSPQLWFVCLADSGHIRNRSYNRGWDYCPWPIGSELCGRGLRPMMHVFVTSYHLLCSIIYRVVSLSPFSALFTVGVVMRTRGQRGHWIKIAKGILPAIFPKLLLEHQHINFYFMCGCFIPLNSILHQRPISVISAWHHLHI